MEQRPLLHLDVVAIEKGALGLPSTKVNNFTLKCFQVFLSYKLHDEQHFFWK